MIKHEQQIVIKPSQKVLIKDSYVFAGTTILLFFETDCSLSTHQVHVEDSNIF